MLDTPIKGHTQKSGRQRRHEFILDKTTKENLLKADSVTFLNEFYTLFQSIYIPTKTIY